MHAPTASDSAAIDAARRLVALARDHYPVGEAWLYGSHARGEARPDSDVDVVIVLETARDLARRATVELGGEAFDVLMETGFFVSPFAISADDWQAPDHYSNPFLIRNIRRDGIRLQ